MTPARAVFHTASDATLVEMISRARRRLLIVGPALTEPVAKALLARIPDVDRTEGAGTGGSGHDSILITVVLDDSAEAYRIGYGAGSEHLKKLQKAADVGQIQFRVEPGVRIGVVISDEDAMIFSPTPQSVEEPVNERSSSESMSRTNAISLSADEAHRLACASGLVPPSDASFRHDHEDEPPESEPKALPAAPEIGVQPFTTDAVEKVTRDLTDNPPQAFDVSRHIRVFSSRVKYVEFKVTNVYMSARSVRLPRDLLAIGDDDLRRRIDGELRPPAELSRSLSVQVETAEGVADQEVTEQWIRQERKRIEDDYTFAIPNYGRVVLTTDWSKFKAATNRLSRNLNAYYAALVAAAREAEEALVASLIDEFLPNLRRQLPAELTRWGEPTEEQLRSYLAHSVQDVVSQLLTSEPPQVRVVRKDIAPESLAEDAFLKGLESSMRSKVPQEIDNLFRFQDAVPSRAAQDRAAPNRASPGGRPE